MENLRGQKDAKDHKWSIGYVKSYLIRYTCKYFIHDSNNHQHYLILSYQILGRTLDIKDRSDKCSELVRYVNETFHQHNAYALKYFVCDILNFANVIGQMYLINFFLGGVFLTYGTDVLKWSEAEPEDRTDPMVDVFPRVTKCTFHKYGPSGTIERHDAMCVLALNIINEKIYVALWFWFIILAVLTALYLLYVLAVISVPSMRKVLIERNAKHDYKDRIDPIMKKAQMGDWYELPYSLII